MLREEAKKSINSKSSLIWDEMCSKYQVHFLYYVANNNVPVQFEL